MGRGIVEAQTLRSEQFEFEARTSDPTDAQSGEYWIRKDQTSKNPDVIAELRRQDNSGVTTCPIFAAAEESNLGTGVTRGPSVVLDDGSVGFVAMTTGNGDVGSPRAVNSAGTQYVTHDALALNPIPDTSMFKSAIYQWAGAAIRAADGTSPVGWPESLSGLADATAVNSPEKQTQSGLKSVEYRRADNDGHDWAADSQLPTGSSSFSWAATVFTGVSNSTPLVVAGYGASNDTEKNTIQLRDGNVQHAFFGVGNTTAGSTTYQTNEFITIGCSFDGSTLTVYLNGSDDGSSSQSPNVQSGPELFLGYEDRDGQNINNFDGYIHEVVLSDAAESAQAFSDYHTARLG